VAKKKRGRLTRKGVAKWLQGRFFLRFHMTLIVAATFLAGLAATKLLLVIGIHSLALRYVLAVCAGYLAFLALIRLWLIYVGIDRSVELSADGIDLLDVRIGSGDVPVPAFDGGGGAFNGGGATASWGDVPSAPVKAVPGGAGDSKPGCGFDFDLGEGFIVALLFIALTTGLLLAGIYVIYTAPALLAEATFEALLAGALLRRARTIDRPGWVGAVWRATVWPFLGVLVLAFVLGYVANRSCPEATRLVEALDCGTRPVQRR